MSERAGRIGGGSSGVSVGVMRRWLIVLSAAQLAVFGVGCQCGEGASKGGDASQAAGGEKVGGLTVTYAGPKGETVEQVVQVSFSEPLFDPGAAGAREPDAVLRVEPEIPGRVEWVTPSSLRYVPWGYLPASTKFTVTVAKGVRGVSGATLAEDVVFTFQTPGVVISSSSPANDSRSLALDTQVRVTLNQAFDLDALAKAFELRRRPGASASLDVPFEVVPATVERPVLQEWERSYSNVETMFSVRALESLKADSTYEVVVKAGFVPKAGAMATGAALSLVFRTYGPLEVKGVTPCKGCAPPTTLWADFTNPVSCGENALPVFEPAAQRVECAWNQEGRTFWHVRLSPNTRYRVTILRGMKDGFGQTTPDDRTFAVETGDYEPEIKWQRAFGVLEASLSPSHSEMFRNISRVTLRSRQLKEDDFVPALRGANLLSSVDSGGAGYYEGSGDGGGEGSGDGAGGAGGASGKPPASIDFSDAKNFTFSENVDTQESRLTFKRVEFALEKHLRGEAGAPLLLDVVGTTDVGGKAVETRTRRLVVVTDLGVTAKLGARLLDVWVNRLSDASVVAGATVSVRDDANRALFTGTTDAAGHVQVAREALVEGDAWPRRLFVFARFNDDLAVLNTAWSEGIEPWQFNVDADTWNWKAAGARVFVHSERGVYRPGHKARIRVVAREWTNDGLRAPKEGSSVLLVMMRGDEEVARQTVVTNGFGSAVWTYEIAKASGLGVVDVRARLLEKGEDGAKLTLSWGEGHGDTSFRVEEYRAAEFRVGVTPASAELMNGETLAATISGDYLFGAPMQGKSVQWSLTRDDELFASSSFAEFRFGPDPAGLGFEMTTFHSDEAKLAANGKVTVRHGLKLSGLSVPTRLNVVASVTDDSGQTLSSSARVLVHPTRHYLGLRAAGYLGEVGKPMTVQAVVVDTKDRATAGAKVVLKLSRQTWVAKQVAAAGGGAYWTNELVESEAGECEVTTGREPVACEFVAKEPGSYVVRGVAEVGGKAGARSKSLASEAVAVTGYTSFYAVGAGEIGWQRYDHDRIELVADKSKYKPGDVARILVKSPWAETDAIVTVERDGVLSSERRKLGGAATTVEVPVTEAMQPNAYVSVTLLRGRRPLAAGSKGGEAELAAQKPDFKMGYVALNVSDDRHRLDVAVKPMAGRYRPGEGAAVSFAVTDGEGKPRAAELAVMVVDEGVLSLTGFATPNPYGFFFGGVPLRVQTAQSRLHVIGQRSFGVKGDEEGGGGGAMGAEDAELRARFEPVAFYSGSVVTDAEGRASVNFVVPDNLTEFRVMAVAASASDHFGKGDGRFKVAKPLMLRAAMPRFVRNGDELLGGVVVNNATEADGTVTVRLAAYTKELLTIEGETEREVAVSRGGSTAVRFRLRATDALGEASLRFEAQMGDERDAVEVKLPVRDSRIGDVVVQEGFLSADATRTLKVPDGAQAKVLSATLSSAPLAAMERKLSSLVEYPYGCLEQRMSRVMPLIAAADLGDRLGLDAVPTDKAREWVAAFVAEVPRFQCYDGGFDYYPGCRWGADPYLTTYVLRGLIEAKAARYAVSQKVIDGALTYVQGYLNGERPQLSGGSPVVDAMQRVAALDVLSRAGKPDVAREEVAFDARGNLPLMAKAALLEAFHRRAPTSKQREVLLGEVKGAIEERGDLAVVKGAAQPELRAIWWNEAMDAAAVFAAMVEADGANALTAKLARTLVAGGFGAEQFTTQATARALMALQRYTTGRSTEGAGAKVALGGKTLAELNATRTLTAARGRVTEFAGAGPLDVALTRSGVGDVFFSLVMSYAYARDAAPPPTGKMFRVARRYTTLAGAPLSSAPRVGDLVRVAIDVEAEADGVHVVVDDALPAGFEAVNAALATEDAQAARSGERSANETWGAASAHRELRDDRVVFAMRQLSRGRHGFAYVARVNAPGVFFAPPTRVEEMYDATRFGRGAAATVSVVERN